MRPIDADQLLDEFHDQFFIGNRISKEELQFIECIINHAPALDDAPALARWKKAGGYGCYCSICGQRVRIKNGENPRLKSFYRYCPNCGAKMDEEEGK